MNRSALVLLFISFAVAQDKPKDKPQDVPKPPAPLTEKEKLTLRNAQVDYMQANDELTKTPQYQNQQTAQVTMNKAVNDIYQSRKLNYGEWVLCDGPGTPPQANPACAGLVKGELELRPVPKTEVPKK